PNLAEGKRGPLAKLIAAIKSVLEKCALHRTEIAIRLSGRGVEDWLIGKRRRRSRELPVQPDGKAHALKLGDRGGSGTPGCLVEEARGRMIGERDDARLTPDGLHAQYRRQYRQI